jgi:hypothetical protein
MMGSNDEPRATPQIFLRQKMLGSDTPHLDRSIELA